MGQPRTHTLLSSKRASVAQRLFSASSSHYDLAHKTQLAHHFTNKMQLGKAVMKLPCLSTKQAARPEEPTSPQQLFDAAAADKDYSMTACLRSLAPRTVILTGHPSEREPMPELEGSAGAERAKPSVQPHGLLGKLVSRFKRLWRRGKAAQHVPAPGPAQSDDDTHAFAVASVSHVEPGIWHGKKAHFIRLHVEYHPDDAHHLETADVSVRVWQAGDALQSFSAQSHLHLLSLRPRAAPEFGDNAPPIVLYGPRAVVGRPAGSAQPYWDGHFAAGDHFVYTAEAMPPLDLHSAGPHANKHARSLLDINTSGNPEEMQPAPGFDIGFVVLSDGKPFDMTAYSTSVHWGLPAVCRYLFDPYKPAKFGASTRLIPKGEPSIGPDFSSGEMKDKLMSHVDWCRPYDTVSTKILVRWHMLTPDMAWRPIRLH